MILYELSTGEVVNIEQVCSVGMKGDNLELRFPSHNVVVRDTKLGIKIAKYMRARQFVRKLKETLKRSKT